MNLQEHIRRILREETNPFKVSDPSTRIEEDRVQIRLGRNKENHFGKVQNIIISVDGEDITSENDVPDLGQNIAVDICVQPLQGIPKAPFHILLVNEGF